MPRKTQLVRRGQGRDGASMRPRPDAAENGGEEVCEVDVLGMLQ